MRIVLLILVPPILLFACALLLMWLPLPAPFPEALSNGRNLMAAVTTGVLGLVYVVGLVVYLTGAMRQSGRAWEQLFSTKGLTAQGYMGVGRQYLGELQGRAVEANYVPGRVLQPALLNIYVTVGVDAEVAVGLKRPLLGCRGCPQLEIAHDDFPQIFANDEQWVKHWLAQPDARTTLHQLLSGQKQAGFRELYLQSGRLWLRAHPSSNVSPEQIEQWLDSLLALAEVSQAVE